MHDTPLIDIAEGQDQENRASLLAAFRRLVACRRRRELTDLHVRELLTYVLSTDRDGRGVQLSYDDIAQVLCCERSTARLVVSRAMDTYGLLAVIESRYARGGQAPNRYAIEWSAVRDANRAHLAVHAPSTEMKPVPTQRSLPCNRCQVPPCPPMLAPGFNTTLRVNRRNSTMIVNMNLTNHQSVNHRPVILTTRNRVYFKCTRVHPGCRGMHPGRRGMHPGCTPIRKIP